MSECLICGRPDQGNAGDYYHKKDCSARQYTKRLETCREDEKQELKKRLDQARYVGD